jgi:hypothetical protein
VVATFSAWGSIQALASDAQGNLFAAGTTSSPDFPVRNAAQPVLGSAKILRSTDGGGTWSKIPNPPVWSSLVPDPVNPQVLFAVHNNVVYKTTDLGTSWRTVYTSEAVTNLTVVVDPAADAYVTTIAADGAVEHSSDGGETWSAGGRVLCGGGLVAIDGSGSGAMLATCYALYNDPIQVYLSRDRGASFTALHPPTLSDGNWPAVVFDPFHRGWIYLASSSQLFWSTDWGQTWTAKASLQPINQLTPDPDQPDTWYALWYDPSAQAVQLNVSSDSGSTWQRRGSPNAFVNPFVMLSRQCGAAGGMYAPLNGLLASSDFGTTWRTVLPQSATPAAGAGCALYAVGTILSDAFVVKLAPGGRQVLWATYLGGTGTEASFAAAADAAGNVWVTGTTTSGDFPATAPRLGPPGVSNVFVAKYDPVGNLLASVVLGGELSDAPTAIAPDANGSAYVVGHTRSTGFPVTAGAVGGQRPASLYEDDGFICKMGPDGRLIYGARIGMPNIYTQLTGVAVDNSGQAVAAGFGAISSQLTPGFVSGVPFLMRLDATGSQVTYSQYSRSVDGQTWDFKPVYLATDDQGSVYVAGTAGQGSTATSGAYVSPVRSKTCYTQGDYRVCFSVIAMPPADIYVTKLRGSDLGTVYTALLGANCASSIGGLTVSSRDGATVSLVTNSGFPLPSPAPPIQGSSGAVARVSADGTALAFSTLLSGSGAPAIAAPPGGPVYDTFNGQITEIPVGIGPRRDPARK